jgi:hypothetical protein
MLFDYLPTFRLRLNLDIPSFNLRRLFRFFFLFYGPVQSWRLQHSLKILRLRCELQHVAVVLLRMCNQADVGGID